MNHDDGLDQFLRQQRPQTPPRPSGELEVLLSRLGAARSKRRWAPKLAAAVALAAALVVGMFALSTQRTARTTYELNSFFVEAYQSVDHGDPDDGVALLGYDLGYDIDGT